MKDTDSRHYLRILCIALGVVMAVAPAVNAEVLITEFMADNKSVLIDEDGEYSDWIEIHNSGATVVSLDGWSLTDDATTPAKWKFPDGIELTPNSYLVVFASDKNRVAGSELHTNFKLSAKGECLGLFNALGEVASAFSPGYPAQLPDVSYGLHSTDLTTRLFFLTPTPGSPNGSGEIGFASQVEFSRSSGGFGLGDPFMLNLSADPPGAIIYYTLDGSEPGPGTSEYTTPILINNSTVVRARAGGSGLMAGPLSSRTYVALSPEAAEFSSDLPVMVLHNFGHGFVPATQEDQEVAMLGFEPRLPADLSTAPRSFLTDPPVHSERGTFHVRGFLTAVDSDKGKASFLLEIHDESGGNKEVKVFGLPKESDWVLYAVNPLDRALIQNPLAHQLRRDMGDYSSRTRFFELFLKDDSGEPGAITMDDYYGLFVLEEKVKRDGNRVDIDSLQPEDSNPPEVTGGYLLSIDDPNGEPQLVAGGAIMNFIDPGGFEMFEPPRAAQLDYIRSYFNSFNAALHGSEWRDPVLGYATYIDIDSWIDYHLHTVVTFNADALRLSTYLYKPRNGKIKFGPPWDFDISQGSAEVRDFNPLIWRSTAFGGSTDYFNVSPWWFKLFRDPDFWQRWIDRYQELRMGTLSTEHIFALIEDFSDEVREAQVREQIRWNAFPRTGPISSDGFFHYFGSEANYDNEVGFKKVWYSQRLKFIDSQFLDRPRLTSSGGQVDRGFELVVVPPSEPGTSVIVTLDGSDPRLPGGGISPSAIVSANPLMLNVTTNISVVARSHNSNHFNRTGPNNPPVSSPWSGPISANVYTDGPRLRITEIMYHPAGPTMSTNHLDEECEFIEVKNTGITPLNVRGFKLTGGVEFEFPDEVLQPGELAVIIANPAAFETRYPSGHRVLGTFAGRLGNAGDHLQLEGPLGEPILEVDYDDDWYPITDGAGFSLVIKQPAAQPDTWRDRHSWRPSVITGGSPGADDPIPSAIPQVVVNEVSSAAVLDVVELKNLSSVSADISGWFLTDVFANPAKYTIPVGTVLQPDEIVIVDENTLGFGLSASGEALHLFSATAGTLTGYSHGFDFGAIESGKTFGRYVTSGNEEQFPEQISPTLGIENSGPQIGDIVISEIYYHPPDVIIGGNAFDRSIDEYIELYNRRDVPVSFSVFDPSRTTGMSSWRLTGGVDFEFRTGQSIPGHGVVLLVAFDPAHTRFEQAFRSRYNVAVDVALYGPFVGSLSDSSDSIELRRPLPPVTAAVGQTGYPLVERVAYTDKSPWPKEADGLGHSLQRIDTTAFGNDSSNWMAAQPSPGRLAPGGTDPLIVESANGVYRVGGTLTGDMDWFPALGIVEIVSTVRVPANAKLTIYPGTTIRIEANAGIEAFDGGMIEVAGTSDQKVVIAPIAHGSTWGELRADGLFSSLIIRHADVSGGRTAVFNGAEGLLEDSYFHDFRPAACGLLECPIVVSSFAASMTVRRCHIREYHETLFREGVISVEDTLFEYASGDALDLDAAQPGTVVRRCTFRHGTRATSNVDAIDIGPGQLGASRGVIVEDCLIFDFPTDKGISIGDVPYPATDIVVRNCLIHGCRFGVQVKDESVVEVYQCTIVDNDWGLNNYSKADPLALFGGGHTSNAHNNILWNNGIAIAMLNSGTLTAEYSNFGSTQWPGTGNIRANPLFLNAALGDYRLDDDSPSRGTGRDGADMGAKFPVGAPMASSHPYFQPIERINGEVVIRFWSDSERSYLVQSSPAVSGDAWETIVEVPAPTVPDLVEIRLSTNSNERRYYRLVAVPNP